MSDLKKVNIFPGRFQPFHNGHLKACEDAFKENGLPVYIMYIHNEKFDSRKPFDDELTKKELERLVDKYEFIEGINWLRRPMPMTICRVCIENGYEPVLWLAGEDRIDGYKKLMKGKSIKDELGIEEPEFYITKRYGSATEVREAIKNDDKDKFKEMMPKEAHDLYNEFKKQLSSIKESKIINYIENKNMKSITTYLNEGKSKISETGKKKLQKQVDKWCKDIKGFMDDYGFCKEDDYYQELETIVWNYAADANIVDFNCNDRDTCWFIDDMVNQLSDKIENS